MATVEEVLKASGWTDEQVAGLDGKAKQGFTTILSTAEQANAQATAAREAAERAERAQKQMYQSEIAPALDGWANEKANMSAQIAFYEKQAEEAKKNGFIPATAPGAPAPPAQDPNTGRFVAGPTGSPQFSPQQQLEALSNVSWFQTEHFNLYGKMPQDEFINVLRESTDQRMSFRDYVAKKYKFDERRQEQAAAKQKEHDDKIRQEAVDSTKKEFAEKFGQNPNVRVAEPSKYTELKKAETAGQRKDPLTLGKQERHQQTQKAILTDMAAATIQ